eukprot:GFUD01013250.1.p1 GENE.GFUD01013250.1~~GFUD01013250.1.p1  ORF type:complete len:223 (+),score=48.55 GFUD01013250.1:138-806(+)
MDLKTLAPCLLSFALYWIFFIPADQPSVSALILKCLPTINLAVAVDLQSKPLSHRQNMIWWGLAFSAIGDAALVWPWGFLGGIVNFAIAHYFYIRSVPTVHFLGKRPLLSVTIGLALYSAGLLIWHLLLRPGLSDPVLSLGVPVYIAWLTTTVWRSAVAGEWVMFLGSAIFMVSDCLIGINEFYMPIANSQEWIMSTYQVAQLLITVTAIREQEQKQKEKEG